MQTSKSIPNMWIENVHVWRKREIHTIRKTIDKLKFEMTDVEEPIENRLISIVSYVNWNFSLSFFFLFLIVNAINADWMCFCVDVVFFLLFFRKRQTKIDEKGNSFLCDFVTVNDIFECVHVCAAVLRAHVGSIEHLKNVNLLWCRHWMASRASFILLSAYFNRFRNLLDTHAYAFHFTNMSSVNHSSFTSPFPPSSLSIHTASSVRMNVWTISVELDMPKFSSDSNRTNMW